MACNNDCNLYLFQLSHKKTAHQNLPVLHNKYNNRLKINKVKTHIRTAKQIEARNLAQTAKVSRKVKLTNQNKNLAIVLIMITKQK